MIKNIFKLFVIFLIILFIVNIAYGINVEMKLKNNPTNSSEVDINNIITEEISIQNNLVKDSIERIPEKYQGYKVSSKLKIEKINLETYVFEDYDEKAMWICPTKYFGPDPNEIGNYCIAAHNYDKENMFNNIIKLKVGDEISLIDNKNGDNSYIVYDIYKSDPKDNSALSQKTNNNIEITLITCSDYSSKRIIVKARKI